jgi:hypothetical protein
MVLVLLIVDIEDVSYEVGNVGKDWIVGSS